MKRVSWFSTLSAFGLVAGIVWAPLASPYENEPTGFGGLEWGAYVPDDMTLVSEDPETWVRRYSRKSDTLRHGRASVEAIYYVFNFAGEFYEVEIFATGRSDNDELYAYLKGMHGDADEMAEEGLESWSLWKGQTTTIEFILDATEYPPESIVIYVGTGVLESTRDMVESALDALDGIIEESDDDEEDPLGALFD